MPVKLSYVPPNGASLAITERWEMMKKINAKMAIYLEERAKEWAKYELLQKRERKGLLENN